MYWQGLAPSVLAWMFSTFNAWQPSHLDINMYWQGLAPSVLAWRFSTFNAWQPSHLDINMYWQGLAPSVLAWRFSTFNAWQPSHLDINIYWQGLAPSMLAWRFSSSTPNNKVAYTSTRPEYIVHKLVTIQESELILSSHCRQNFNFLTITIMPWSQWHVCFKVDF